MLIFKNEMLIYLSETTLFGFIVLPLFLVKIRKVPTGLISIELHSPLDRNYLISFLQSMHGKSTADPDVSYDDMSCLRSTRKTSNSFLF